MWFKSALRTSCCSWLMIYVFIFNTWHRCLLVTYQSQIVILNQSFIGFEFFCPNLLLVSPSVQTKPTLIVVTLNKIYCFIVGFFAHLIGSNTVVKTSYTHRKCSFVFIYFYLFWEFLWKIWYLKSYWLVYLT